MSEKTDKPVITIDEEKNVAILTIEKSTPIEATKEQPYLVSPRTGAQIQLHQDVEKYGIDTLTEFVGWSCELAQYIQQSLQDGRYTWVEKATTAMKFVGGVSNLSQSSLSKIGIELDDLSENEVEIIAQQIRRKLVLDSQLSVNNAILFAKNIVIAIQAIKHAIEISRKI